MKYLILSIMSILIVSPISIHAQKSLLDRDCKQSFLRKGSHLGIHISPGVGRIDDPYSHGNLELGYGINTGIDYAYYFNNLIGLKTGIVYTMIPSNFTNIKYYDSDQNGGLIYPPHSNGETNGVLKSVGIPIMVLITTGKEFGFYFEGGFIVGFPFTTYKTNTFPYYGRTWEEEIYTENIVISAQCVAGVNYVLKEKTSYNLGLLAQTPISTYYKYRGAKKHQDNGFLLGLQFGVMYKLSK